MSIGYFWPEILLTAGILVLVVLELVRSDEWKSRWMPGIAGIFVMGTMIAAAFLLRTPPQTLFGGMLVVDPFASALKILIGFAFLFTLVVSVRNPELREYGIGEYTLLLLGLYLGCALLVGAEHLLMVVLALEMVSIPSYLLVAYRKTHHPSVEAAMKYIVFGAAATGSMLYAISWIYGLTGALYLPDVARRLHEQSTTGTFPAGWVVVMVFLIAGIAFKISAVPFHFWAPDAYQGAATPISALLTVAPKAAGFGMLIRIFYQGFSIYNPDSGTWEAIPGLQWPIMLSILATATMTWGNVVAIWQRNIKRMLAYSSIAHAGYMLMAVLTGTHAGLQALLFYIAAYTVMNLGAFYVVIAMADITDRYEDFTAYSGLARRHPGLAWMMAFFLLSLAGIPPLIGFFGKFFLFAAAIRAGWTWLAVLAVINSAISLFYYVYVIKNMVIEAPGEYRPLLRWGPAYRVVQALAVLVLLLGILFAPVYGWSDRHAALNLHPTPLLEPTKVARMR